MYEYKHVFQVLHWCKNCEWLIRAGQYKFLPVLYSKNNKCEEGKSLIQLQKTMVIATREDETQSKGQLWQWLSICSDTFMFNHTNIATFDNPELLFIFCWEQTQQCNKPGFITQNAIPSCLASCFLDFHQSTKLTYFFFS